MGDFSQAVKVPDVAAEYQHVRATSCACGGVFAGRGQTLLTDPATGRRYDEIDAVCAICGVPRKFLFDISSFFGKEPPRPRSETGCFVLIWVLATAAAAGGVLAWRKDLEALAIVAWGAAALLAWLGRPGKPAPPPEFPPRLQRPGDTDIFQKMERLGIPFEGTNDTKGALIGGASKSGLYRHLQALEARRWDEATEGLDSTIDLLTKQSGARWTQVLSVAHRLRAQAHEGAGRKAEALADYERALILMPDDAEARAGQARLSS